MTKYTPQHGFIKGRSTVTQFPHVLHDILKYVNEGKKVDMRYIYNLKIHLIMFPLAY